MRQIPQRAIAAAAIVAAGFCLVASIYIIGLSDKNAAQRDYIEYWAAGKQLIRGADPYDPVAILHIERAVGLEGYQPKVNFSPPVTLFVALPLGLVSAKIGLVLWLLFILACPSPSGFFGYCTAGQTAVCICSATCLPRSRLPDGRAARHLFSAWPGAFSSPPPVPPLPRRGGSAALRREAPSITRGRTPGFAGVAVGV